MNEMAPADYQQWLSRLKVRILSAQQRAALAVNQQLISLYWQIGNDILQRQHEQGWGSKGIDRLARDLRQAFPEMKGFSRSNLLYMRSFSETWPDFEQNPIVQQAVGQIPWGHNLVLLSKVKKREQRLAYAQSAQQYCWSRNVLVHQIESRLLERQGNATTNFVQTLPAPHSELAQQTLKDPYVFDFLSMGAEAHERDIEQALTQHISQFLLELGAGFAFVGKQVPLEIGGQDFYLDLLFYHLKLRCYLVIELKSGDFNPSHVGQLSFYLTAVDEHFKTEQDAPTIGLLLCKSRNKIIAEYALRDNSKPIGVAEYQIAQSLPEDFADKLPSIERLEQELQSGWADE
ncbi:PDDEXK nuclease domain-containing protein [Methylicorpusculum sp.]|uniref:PDDEXK nuclease domain-containing protein n=1 Tax=Methylicorpusculum sp. TaxID=2713644 RepID=UPI0027305E16|nr:PDDEXK nuclease domain-containing protein [Methylicorpusculum sp.]MDP2177649.1 PDDEXK nuclease domain-containing protein [Methylicorpusculum sp.]MDP3528593.1 PDDEXK nuclease domain-containing protein [Methylicorpusculum sp.]MDZ4152938.1 PDDEXK nuclease domain-containing protein [Methylicorpusculum sp.]